MIDAVTLADAQRVAKRLLDRGLLVTVVGPAEGGDLERGRLIGSRLRVNVRARSTRSIRLLPNSDSQFTFARI